MRKQKLLRKSKAGAVLCHILYSIYIHAERSMYLNKNTHARNTNQFCLIVDIVNTSGLFFGHFSQKLNDKKLKELKKLKQFFKRAQAKRQKPQNQPILTYPGCGYFFK